MVAMKGLPITDAPIQVIMNIKASVCSMISAKEATLELEIYCMEDGITFRLILI